jgi:hypothetical protein
MYTLVCESFAGHITAMLSADFDAVNTFARAMAYSPDVKRMRIITPKNVTYATWDYSLPTCWAVACPFGWDCIEA